MLKQVKGMAYLCLVTQQNKKVDSITLAFNSQALKRLSWLGFLLLLLLSHHRLTAQEDSTQVNPKRFKQVVYVGAGVYAGTLLALNQLWYADYERSDFHRFNDNKQWLQMDKLGHVYSAHLGGAIGYEALRYAGFSNKKSALYGGGLGFVFLSTIEVFDGYSEGWGFSWGDMASNGIGAGLFIGQQLAFEKQIIQPKFSYSPSEYRQYRPEVLGEEGIEAVFKDYNAQTYWASVNLNNLFSSLKPTWLSLAFGYGGNEMISARGDYTIPSGEVFSPYRQYFLGLDVDLTKIKTKKPWVRNLLKAANYVKFPAPTMEFREGGSSKFHFLFF